MNKSEDYSQRPAFRRIQDLVRKAFCEALQADWPTAQKMMAGGKSADLRGDYALMNQLETCIFELEGGHLLKQGFQALQYPVNIRAVAGEPPKDYLSRPYATDYLHCDVWSGAPTNSVNYFLYIFTEGNCSSLRIWETIKEDPYASSFRGPYSEFKGDPSKLKEVHSEIKAGIMHAFDTYCPHKTHRTGEGLRISIDFRVKTDSPYYVEGEKANAEKFSNYSPGNPGPGIYWTMPDHPLESFEAKCEYELQKAAEQGPWAVELRKGYIQHMKEHGLFKSASSHEREGLRATLNIGSGRS